MTFLYLNSNTLGSGDFGLGQKLLNSFIKKLADSNVQVDVIGCVNSAALLTTEQSDILENLKRLESKGAKIATCKTCLEHYNRIDKLLVGEIGTMDQTIEILSKADKIINP